MTMKKKVNIQSQYPLYVFTPPLTGVINGAELTCPEIYNCLGQGATINEVLSDGSEIRLTYQNYNKVNLPEPKVEKEETKVKLADEIPPEEPKDEDPEQPGVESDEIPPEEPKDETKSVKQDNKSKNKSGKRK